MHKFIQTWVTNSQLHIDDDENESTEICTELNSADFQILSGKEWLNDKVHMLYCVAIFILCRQTYVASCMLDQQIMMKYLSLLQSEAEKVKMNNI